MTLYDYVLSSGCYKVRLFAALLGVELTIKAVNFYPAKDHKSPSMLALNPAGTLPVLEDGDLVLTQSTAILSYIAANHGPKWLGDGSPKQSALVQEWLAFSGALNSSLGLARLHDMLQYEADIHLVRQAGVRHLRHLEAWLTEQGFRGEGFFTGGEPTMADIACFPSVMLAPDGGVTLDVYPAIRHWTRAIRSLPDFIEMPGIHRLHELVQPSIPDAQMAEVG
mgnify:CR=1 FL=1